MKHGLQFNKNNTCKRIIRAFEESGEKALTTQEIVNILFQQRTSTGKLFTNNFTRHTITQTLNKYPFFTKVGSKTVKDRNTGYSVNCWSIVEEEE
tara:strand:- start:7535 stop:7819 length:285 start_codon:yes stop_codon:yes gene_type:complete